MGDVWVDIDMLGLFVGIGNAANNSIKPAGH